MQLNSLKPAAGSHKAKRRKGRGGKRGKNCGSGHKGQKSRSGGSVPIGFEGGQMPLHRRLPKFGFTSRKSLYSKEIRLEELNKLEANEIDFAALRANNVIKNTVKYVKIVLKGKIERAIKLRGIRITEGAKKAIVAAGGTVD